MDKTYPEFRIILTILNAGKLPTTEFNKIISYLDAVAFALPEQPRPVGSQVSTILDIPSTTPPIPLRKLWVKWSLSAKDFIAYEAAPDYQADFAIWP